MSSLSHKLLYDFSFENSDPEYLSLNNSISLIKSGNIFDAYNLLLSSTGDSSDSIKPDLIWLQIQCLDLMHQYSPIPRLIKSLSALLPSDDFRILHSCLQYKVRQGSAIDPKYLIPSSLFTDGLLEFPHLLISAIDANLCIKNIAYAENLLAIAGDIEGIDFLIVRAKLAQSKNDDLGVESLLLPYFDRYVWNLDFCELLIETMFRLRRENTCVPTLRQALSIHQRNSSYLLSRFAEAKLLQRQPASGLHHKLLERINNSISSDQQPPTCLSTAYDSLGRSEWFKYIHPELIQRPGMAVSLSSNLMMHCSSQALDFYPKLAENLTSFFYNQWKSIGENCIGPFTVKNNINKLKIGWICGDIANHPVFRFMYSWFYSSLNCKTHDHFVVATHPVTKYHAQLLLDLEDISFIDLSNYKTMPEHLHAIRSQEFDLVIDLNGWTANNIAPVFIARVAPVQVNYLAYHASSGFPNMDAWIVDHNLIPADRCEYEWHTEKIIRLSRPFLAWEPPLSLPEGQVKKVVPLAFDKNSPIRFGSFNNLRKISDSCLDIWSTLLNRVPNSILVLKAFADEDLDTQYLIKQRFLTAGINLDRIIFLPFTSTPDEHLLQYSHMDVALDSYPNTGCTTTCEALWMGVPVLSLYGNHYVSRMAHAVLCGAGLPDWSFSDPKEMLDYAVSLSEPSRLKWLRQNRNYWRKKLLDSPLGDAKDLFEQIELTFSNLYNSKLPSSDNSALL